MCCIYLQEYCVECGYILASNCGEIYDNRLPIANLTVNEHFSSDILISKFNGSESSSRKVVAGDGKFLGDASNSVIDSTITSKFDRNTSTNASLKLLQNVRISNIL